jgi:hypothetical protein
MYFFPRAKIFPSVRQFSHKIHNGLGKNGLADPNCTVLIIDAGRLQAYGSSRSVLLRCWILCRTRFAGRKLIVENNTEKRAVDFQPAVVVNKSQFPESVHEKTHSRPGRADHFR